MKGYKGFEPGLICRGKQYAENTVFEEDTAKICESGMHFCENPFAVLEHYGFVNDNAEINVFASVESIDEPVTDDNIKFSCKKLRIGAKIGIPGLVRAFVDYTIGKIDTKNASATNTENFSVATNTGSFSVATNTGSFSAATNTGYQSAATNTGSFSAATNTGNQSAATNTGNQSAATNTGGCSVATNTGSHSVATNTGYQSAASVEGIDSFAIATGIDSKARGEIGCYIALAEWIYTTDKGYVLADFKSHKVDGDTIKPNTWYKLKNGEFVEA